MSLKYERFQDFSKADLLIGIDALIKHYGSKTGVANACGVHKTAIQNWIRAGQVPAGWAMFFEHDTRGAVPRHIIRPDLYPPAEYKLILEIQHMARKRAIERAMNGDWGEG